VDTRPGMVAAAFLLSVPFAGAGEPLLLRDGKGRTVAVWAPSRVEGRLTAFDASTVTIELPNGDAAIVARSRVDRMQVKIDRSVESVSLGVAGAAFGGGVGLAVVAFDHRKCLLRSPGCTADSPPYRTGILIGAAVGALVTVFPIWRQNGWRDIEVRERVEVSVIPVRGGVGALARVTF
jgi:hypothetical protein